MSLLSILSNATNALLNTQSQINVVSQNIGNAQNPNYSQRSSVVIDKSGSTEIVDVQRAVDGTLQSNYLNQTSQSAAANTISQFYTQLEQLTGSSTSSPVLTTAVQNFQSAWQALQATPEDKSIQAQVVSSAESLVSTLQNVSHGVEQLAGQVSTQLGSDVGTLNSSLSQIATLNAQIVAGKRSGQDTSALEDNRDTLITTVAGLVPVQQQINGDGSIYLSTPSGVSLVQQSASHFSYDQTSDTIYNTSDPAKTSLNGALTTGQIGAEVGILSNNTTDVPTINNYVSGLNTPLAQLAAANKAAAATVPVPAAPTAAQSAALALIQAQLPSATATTQNADGTISLATTGGVSLVTASGASQFAYSPTTNTIYDTVSGTSLNSQLAPAGGATPDSAATGALQAVSAATAGGPGSAPLFQLRNQLNSIADLFYSSTTPTGFQQAYDSASPANSGELAGSFFTMGGNPSGTASDRFNLQVNPALVNGTATIKQSAAVGVAAELTAGTASTTALGVTNAIASDQSGRAAASTSAQTAATANTSAAQQAYRNVTGVSSDQQLAQLVSLQNAYSAAAKIISTVQELETTLLTAVGGS